MAVLNDELREQLQALGWTLPKGVEMRLHVVPVGQLPGQRASITVITEKGTTPNLSFLQEPGFSINSNVAAEAATGMTQLEQTIIERAREHLDAVKAFYAQIKAGTTDDDARDDYRRDHAQLYALLEFGHMSGSGMSTEGRAALLAVEEAGTAALREYSAPTSPELNIDVRWQDGRTESVDVSKAEHSLVLGAFAPKTNR